MGKILTEDMLEKAFIDKVVSGLDNVYEHINAYINYKDVVNKNNVLSEVKDGTGRSNVKEVVLPKILFESLKSLNPHIPQELLRDIVEDLRVYSSNRDLKDINYSNYKKIKDGIRVEFQREGKTQQEIVRLIDFDVPYRNRFTVISQMWIKGEINFRRPDLIIFINGLPLVFIELKNSDVKVKTAYDKNLKDYIRDIPQLFYHNQFCVISNGSETRLGSFTAGYEHFFEWLRVTEEDKVNRDDIYEKGTSLEYLIEGLLSHVSLLDYIENFILYENKREKIIAKNHQFLGVNNAYANFLKRDQLDGKLGVFWHTQGSGKSYSMGMYVNKINRKISGNFTFLLVTDRVDLDGQLYKNFIRTEIVTEEDSAQPRNSRELREDLQTNKAFIFTLIHKFGYEKGRAYPLLSERDDIIVLVDEAHRTQYKDLAQNMRAGIPNANYIAFTGTPLLGSKRLTNQWFGDYVSEYNFARSIEDGSTVPLYYSRRVPEVGIIGDNLDDELYDLVEREDLTDDESKRLEDHFSQTMEVIKREDRLNIVAKDIVNHFAGRGYLGKAMVVSVDKFTAVKMYDKVKANWNPKILELSRARSFAETEEEKEDLDKRIQYMKEVEMAVVISQGDDDDKFERVDLDIHKHRKRLAQIDENGHDIEDNFKDPNHPLSLVFICAMWLTGFDAPAVSTLYLDKPMKGHTLMQAIARINRVFPGKSSGMIVDYLNIFKSMQRALGDYANPDTPDEMPVKNIDEMLELLDQTVEETRKFCFGLGIDFEEVLDSKETFEKTSLFDKYLDIILEKDAYKDEFKIHANLCRNIFEASKPEVFERNWNNDYLSPILFLDKKIGVSVRDEKIEKAKEDLTKTLDTTVYAEPVELKDGIKEMRIIDLSELDTSKVKRRIDGSPYKFIEIEELRLFIEIKLEELINRNKTRIKFSERYKSIVDRYNAGNTTNEDYYRELIEFTDEMKAEDRRRAEKNLSEEELELFDILKKEKLTQKEEADVILSAKKLYEALTREESELRIIDWYKDEQPRRRVKLKVEEVLDNHLPYTYGKEIFDSKSEMIYTHLLEDAMTGVEKYLSS